jgi:hypothetical protein
MPSSIWPPWNFTPPYLSNGDRLKGFYCTIGFRTLENGGVRHLKTQKKKPNFGGNTHVTLNPKPWVTLNLPLIALYVAFPCLLRFILLSMLCPACTRFLLLSPAYSALSHFLSPYCALPHFFPFIMLYPVFSQLLCFTLLGYIYRALFCWPCLTLPFIYHILVHFLSLIAFYPAFSRLSRFIRFLPYTALYVAFSRLPRFTVFFCHFTALCPDAKLICFILLYVNPFFFSLLYAKCRNPSLGSRPRQGGCEVAGL